MPIVWERPDGSILVTHLTNDWLEENRLEGESTDAAVARLARKIQAKAPWLQGLTPILVKTADMPTDRSRRRDWRLDKSNPARPAVPNPRGRVDA